MSLLRIESHIQQIGKNNVYYSALYKTNIDGNATIKSSGSGGSSSENKSYDLILESQLILPQVEFKEFILRPIELAFRGYYAQFSKRYDTFLNCTFFKENTVISEYFANNGFYIDSSNLNITCCKECISYNVVDIINIIKYITEKEEEEKEEEEEEENWERKISNLREKIPLMHLNKCCYSKPVARSKLFFAEAYSLYFESERLNSFIEFPHFNHFGFYLSPDVLAMKGFYYERGRDAITCVFCGSTFCELDETLANGDADQIFNHPCEHERSKFNISLEMGIILEDIRLEEDDYFPIGIPDNITIVDVRHKDCNLSQMGVFQLGFPIHTKFKGLKEREESFIHANWPHNELFNISCQELARAGFFYIGIVLLLLLTFFLFAYMKKI